MSLARLWRENGDFRAHREEKQDDYRMQEQPYMSLSTGNRLR